MISWRPPDDDSALLVLGLVELDFFLFFLLHAGSRCSRWLVWRSPGLYLGGMERDDLIIAKL